APTDISTLPRHAALPISWPCARRAPGWWPSRPTRACSRPWPRSWATTRGSGSRWPTPSRAAWPRSLPQAPRMVANLPYNIAATLVLKVLAEAPAITDQVVMVQREVGERLAAAPGSAAYGAPSAKLAAQATARVLSPGSRHLVGPAQRGAYA